MSNLFNYLYDEEYIRLCKGRYGIKNYKNVDCILWDDGFICEYGDIGYGDEPDYITCDIYDILNNHWFEYFSEDEEKTNSINKILKYMSDIFNDIVEYRIVLCFDKHYDLQKINIYCFTKKHCIHPCVTFVKFIKNKDGLFIRHKYDFKNYTKILIE